MARMVGSHEKIETFRAGIGGLGRLLSEEGPIRWYDYRYNSPTMSVRHHDDAVGRRRFSLRMGLGGIVPDPWIEDGEGHRVFQVDEMARARLDRFILRDLHGNEVATLRETIAAQDATLVERQGAALATVRRTRIGLRHRFSIDVVDDVILDIDGHVGRHEYEIRRGEEVVATVSTKWFRGHDRYGVEVGAGEDEAMVLAATVAIEDLDRGERAPV